MHEITNSQVKLFAEIQLPILSKWSQEVGGQAKKPRIMLFIPMSNALNCCTTFNYGGDH